MTGIHAGAPNRFVRHGGPPGPFAMTAAHELLRPLPPSVSDYLDSIVGATRAQLGEDLVGICAIGSIALGDFQPATSDVDLIVVTADSLPMDRRHALADAVAGLPIPVRGLECVVYPRQALARPASRPRWEINLNAGPRLPARHETFDPADEDRYWAVLDLAVARESALALVGPPAAELFPEISRALVAEALREGLEWHGAWDGASPNRVLNTARAWYWAVEGRLVSKSEAAGWANARTGETIVSDAQRVRATGEGSLDPAAVSRFAATAEAELLPMLRAADSQAGDALRGRRPTRS
jgi:hypothetical protein